MKITKYAVEVYLDAAIAHLLPGEVADLFDASDFSPSAEAKAEEDLSRFLSLTADVLYKLEESPDLDISDVAADFCATRSKSNGIGFPDNLYGKNIARELTRVAKQFDPIFVAVNHITRELEFVSERPEKEVSLVADAQKEASDAQDAGRVISLVERAKAAKNAAAKAEPAKLKVTEDESVDSSEFDMSVSESAVFAYLEEGVHFQRDAKLIRLFNTRSFGAFADSAVAQAREDLEHYFHKSRAVIAAIKETHATGMPAADASRIAADFLLARNGDSSGFDDIESGAYRPSDSSNLKRFADSYEPISYEIGSDGLIYQLARSGSTASRFRDDEGKEVNASRGHLKLVK